MSEPRQSPPSGRPSTKGSGISASSRASSFGVAFLQRLERIAAVAEQVEIEAGRLCARRQSASSAASGWGWSKGSPPLIVMPSQPSCATRLHQSSSAGTGMARDGSAGQVSCDTQPLQRIVQPCSHKPIRRPGPSTVTGKCALLRRMFMEGCRLASADFPAGSGSQKLRPFLKLGRSCHGCRPSRPWNRRRCAWRLSFRREYPANRCAGAPRRACFHAG